MKHRWSRKSFSGSRSFRAMVERAFAEAFASLEPRPASRRKAAPDRSPSRKEVPVKGWLAWVRRRPEDSLA